MHLIVDGYNMIRAIEVYTREEGRSLRHGRELLLEDLENYLSQGDDLCLVVFDANFIRGTKNSEESFAGIDIIFASALPSADDVILEKIKEFRKDGEQITLVTNDNLLRIEAVYAGANTMSPEKLYEKMKAGLRIK